MKYKPKYYLALIEKKFYRMLRISFGFELEQKGEELIGQSTVLIPVAINIEKLLQDNEPLENCCMVKKTKYLSPYIQGLSQVFNERDNPLCYSYLYKSL